MNDFTPLTIHLAADHAGFELKNAAKLWLLLEGYEVVDHGAHTFSADDDYPDFISLAARAVSLNPTESRGILFGGSGQGEAMVANRFPQVRATVYYGGDKHIITLSREHNDANVLSLGVRFVSAPEAKDVILEWLTIPSPSEEKYLRRINKAEQLTK
jgi:ribose 5-phosphate isomerase B